MSWFDRKKTVELTDKLEKTPAGTCPVCGDTPLLALVPKEEAGVKLSMLSLGTGETMNHFLFDMVMCSRCGYTRLHQHDAMQEWLNSWLDGMGEGDDNERT